MKITAESDYFCVDYYTWDAGVGCFKAILMGTQPRRILSFFRSGPVKITVDGIEFIGFRALVIHTVGNAMFFEGTYEIPD